MRIYIGLSIVLLVYGVLYSGKGEITLVLAEKMESEQQVEKSTNDIGDEPSYPLFQEEPEYISRVEGDEVTRYKSESLDVLVGLDDDCVHCGCGLLRGESRLHGKKQAYGTFMGYEQP